jgi:hypothetical protein
VTGWLTTASSLADLYYRLVRLGEGCVALQQRPVDTNTAWSAPAPLKNGAALHSCRCGGKGADGTCPHAELRARANTGGTPWDAESEKAKTSINVIISNRATSTLFRPYIGSHLNYSPLVCLWSECIKTMWFKTHQRCRFSHPGKK